jgi:hypothetical protein
MQGRCIVAPVRVVGRKRAGTRLGMAVVLVGCALAAPADAGAQSAMGPLNDLFALGQGSGQTPDVLPTLRRAEPPFVPTPRAHCAAGTRTEPGIQGRVPAGSAQDGLACNVTLLAHQGTSGGFKVWRYIDVQGRECAYYDTALLLPLNALTFSANGLGVAVLDMTDPSHPVQTDTLTELPMLSPHESVTVNAKRGLIAAVLGNPATYPGLVSIYDAHADCRHPVLQSTALVARFGHESGFAPDGRTFYATGTAVRAITAIDVTDPKNPHAIWHGNVVSHGMTLSDDGNRAYIADPTGHSMLILDTSEIQARKPNPQAREVSRLSWKAASIPQNAIPFTEDGKPYVLEFDEYTAGTSGSGNSNDVGAARIIDISDERAPRVVALLRLQVNQPTDHSAANGDPGAQSPVQGYAAHYCNVPTRVDPKIVACSFIASGLRVFDISDLTSPKEIAYFVSPTLSRAENGFSPSDFAMSQPAFAPERHEIWYADGTTGFYALRVNGDVWPASPCQSRAGTPHGYVIRSTLRGSRRGVSVRGRAFAFCGEGAALPSRTVKRVTISIARVTGGRCRFLTARGALTPPRSCRRPVALPVRGGASWTFSRRVALAQGSYRVYVQATDADGRQESQPQAQNARFRVR